MNGGDSLFNLCLFLLNILKDGDCLRLWLIASIVLDLLSQLLGKCIELVTKNKELLALISCILSFALIILKWE